MAARGNRITGVGRFGVAFLATAVFGLASLQPAFAESAPAPPPETTNADTTSTPPAEPAETTESEAPPAEPAPTPQPADPPAEPDPTPSADTADSEAPDAAEPAPDEAAEPDSTPTEQAPAETKPAPAETKPTQTAAPKDAVKLEPAPAAAPAAAAAPTGASPAAAAPAAAQPTVVILIQNEPAHDSEAAKAEAALAAAAIVSFRARPSAGPISLLPATEPATTAPRKARGAKTARKPLTRQQSCARPAGRVPLSDKCKQVRAVAGARVTFTALQSLPEVRAAIARGTPPRATIRHVDARPPPKSKAAKKRPIAEARPIVPFGDSGQGVTNDGFNGSTGSSSSSRVFAVAIVPLRVPWPFRFARLRLPSTRPHGVIPAPPSARPG